MPWRIKSNPKVNTLLIAVLFWVGWVGLFIATLKVFALFPGFNARMQGMKMGIVGLGVALGITWAFGKFRKIPFKEMGLTWQRATIFRFIKGFILGTAIFSIIILSLLKFGSMQLITGTKPINPSLLVSYLAFIPLALMEEIAFRAYSFNILNQAFGLRITQMIVAIAFALYHVAGGHSLFMAFAGPFVWSFVFGLSAVWSGGIAVPTGIHVALNVLQIFVGMKGGAESIWKLSFPEGTSKELIARTGQIGMVSQLAVLIVAVLLTEHFIRNKTTSTIPG